MKKFQIILVILALLLLNTVGCAENSKSTVSITSSIEKYALFMSSVPGFPLQATADPASDPSNTEYIWKTSVGSFLSWGQGTDYKVTDLGAEYISDESLIYLSPPIDSEIPAEGIQVTVEIRKKDSHDLIGQGSVFIDYSDNYFIIR